MLKSNNINDFPVLSNEDVQLLYEIITAAGASNSPPFRALFAAYDDVLSKHGLKKEHDQIYFRFLLRMREGRRSGESLFSQFRSLLDKMDIQVDIDNEEEEDKENIPIQQNRPDVEHHARRPSQTLSRRASFDSVYDTLAEERKYAQQIDLDPIQRPASTDISKQRPISHSGRAPSEAHLQPATRRSRSGSGNLTKIGDLASVPPRQRFSNRDWGTTTKHRAHTVPEHDGYSAESESIVSQDESDDESLDERENAERAPKIAGPVHPKWLPKLDANAKTLRYHQVAARALRLFRQWHAKTTEASRVHQAELQRATLHDKKVLQRQSLDQWQALLAERRKRRDAEKVYEILEEKAVKARDLFLLTKAFTHWAQCASDEVMRTSTAKRHVMRTRCFNAWRDITVVNELKVRRQGLVKFFGVWKRRAIVAFQSQENALIFYENTLIQKQYRQWFWQFCESKAPIWYQTRVKESFLKKWIAAARQEKDRRAVAGDFYRLVLTNKALLPWTRKLVQCSRNGEDASAFHKQMLLATTLTTLRKALAYSPMQGSFTRKVEERIKRSTLSVFVHKTRLAVQSDEVNDLRIMRKAWAAWNDGLRSQVLRRTIDDRVTMGALYRWVLAERFALFERTRLQRLKSRTIDRWSLRATTLFETLGRAKSLVERSCTRRASTTCLRTWANRADKHDHDDRRAREFCNANTLRRVFGQLRTSCQRVLEHQDWAKDARFYVLCSRTIKTWRSEAETTRRARRREAYTTFRRKKKTDHTQMLLLQWRDKSNAVAELHAKAEQARQEHMSRHLLDVFNTLSSRLASFSERTDQATTIRERHLLRTHLDSMSERLGQIRHAGQKADEFLLETTTSAAAGLLRKFNWLLFQVKRKHETAESLAERNTRKHHRSMLRFWAETAVWRRDTASSPSLSLSLASRVPQGGQGSQRRKQQQRANVDFTLSLGGQAEYDNDNDNDDEHDESFLEDSLLDRASGQIKTPAYLRTPLRRTTRLRSQVLTPATTQITPFAERLRGRSTQDRARSVRGDFARRLAAAATVAAARPGTRGRGEDGLEGRESESSPLRRP